MFVSYAHFQTKELGLLPLYKPYNAFKMIDNIILDNVLLCILVVQTHPFFNRLTTLLQTFM